jgi:hypothetical protein
VETVVDLLFPVSILFLIFEINLMTPFCTMQIDSYSK